MTEPSDYVVVHVNASGHRYWTGAAWDDDLEKAALYPYGESMRIIWSDWLGFQPLLEVPEDVAERGGGKLTAIPRSVLREIASSDRRT